ncbi:MAG: sensor histidine kinase [Candidatus Obscuribacterales bacterium]|nr:sensor histidine kinase [Candidatus Obscuribacterales bacterium]
MRIEQGKSSTMLIANALKYSNDRSNVLVSCSKSATEVIFEVTDEGKGIAEELKERLFERYEQGDKSQRRVGYGLGLHIAKVIVEAHRGRIGVKNLADGKTGAIFYFSLPVN